MTDFFGGGEYLSSGNIVAGNSVIHGEILEVTKGAFTEEGVAPLANGLI